MASVSASKGQQWEDDPLDTARSMIGSFHQFAENQYDILLLTKQAEESQKDFKKLVQQVRDEFQERINGGLTDQEIIDAFEQLGRSVSQEDDAEKKQARRNAFTQVFETLPTEQSLTYLQTLHRHFGSSREHAHIFPGLLVALVSQAEVVIREFIEAYAKLNPEAFLTGEREVKFSEIRHLKTIEEIEEFLIQKRIDAILYKGFSDWVDFLVKETRIDANSIANLEQVNEIFQRRHCHIHNGGRVSRLYLARTGLKHEVGEYLSVNGAYLRKSADFLYVFVYSLFTSLCFKLVSKKSGSRGEIAADLTHFTFELLVDKRYSALKLLHNNLRIDALPPGDKIVIQTNMWLAFKYSGEFNKVAHELDQLDEYSDSIRHKIVKAALLDQVELVRQLTGAGLIAGEITQLNLVTWPLLRDVYPRYEREFEELLNSSLFNKSDRKD